ncbi:MAG TPA: hypothetical protein VFC52_07450 [Solirubrobacterales bacterium]|nr:hypothetical protein [Solirubrobacterales bacterium]
MAQLTPVKPGRAEDWIGAMRDRGEVTGDLVAPAAEPGEWNALSN